MDEVKESGSDGPSYRAAGASASGAAEAPSARLSIDHDYCIH
jgi:hypothetical protein